jgi:hypothetical protein
VDPEHRLGGGGLARGRKKIVTFSNFVANWVAEHLLVQNVLEFLYL